METRDESAGKAMVMERHQPLVEHGHACNISRPVGGDAVARGEHAYKYGVYVCTVQT